jgi:DNA-binding NtrC family response regulator
MQPESPPRVLVVDDEFEMAAVLADSLRESGFEAFALRSGREALEVLRHESVDVIVTDLRMPGVDGLKLLRKSRELDPTRPVILMTAHGALDSALEAATQGAYHYLTKPFSPKYLVGLVERALLEAQSPHGPLYGSF